jgi:hypothetical protein
MGAVARLAARCGIAAGFGCRRARLSLGGGRVVDGRRCAGAAPGGRAAGAISAPAAAPRVGQWSGAAARIGRGLDPLSRSGFDPLGLGARDRAGTAAGWRAGTTAARHIRAATRARSARAATGALGTRPAAGA